MDLGISEEHRNQSLGGCQGAGKSRGLCWGPEHAGEARAMGYLPNRPSDEASPRENCVACNKAGREEMWTSFRAVKKIRAKMVMDSLESTLKDT